MERYVFILARESSDRFPLKHLTPIAGTPLLQRLKWVFEDAGCTPVLVTGTYKDNFHYADYCTSIGMDFYCEDWLPEWDIVGRLNNAYLARNTNDAVIHSGDCVFPDTRIMDKLWTLLEVNPGAWEVSTYITPHAMGGERAVNIKRRSYWQHIDALLKQEDRRREQWGSVPEVQRLVNGKGIVLPPDFDTTKTRMKVSIDWPLEAAIATKIVEHLGRWPETDEDILTAYREITSL